MFRIGDFSRITYVPITQLRYYDEIGLFKPAHIDADSGYRYYSAEQIPRLNRILALRDLGLSLEQVARLLDDQITSEEIRGMLMLRKAQIEQSLRDEITRLNQVEVRLAQIEQEGAPYPIDVVLKSLPPQTVIARREVLKSYDPVIATMQRALRLLPDTRRFSGVPLSVMYSPEYSADSYDLLYGFVTHSGSPPPEFSQQLGMSIRELPGVEQTATAVFTASWSNVGLGYQLIASWIESHGYTLAGPVRELYLHLEADTDLPSNVTEFQFPVRQL